MRSYAKPIHSRRKAIAVPVAKRHGWRQRAVWHRAVRSRGRRNVAGAFTLVQLMVTLAILGILASLGIAGAGRARGAAQRAQCDMRLKTIAIALDAHRQEVGRYPQSLRTLVAKKYLKDEESLSCPSDPREAGSYNAFYLIRSPRAQQDVAAAESSSVATAASNQTKTELAAELPLIACPLHGEGQGGQAFTSTRTSQFATRPAILSGGTGVTVQRPGDEAIAAAAGMQLHGGDRIRTGAGGGATIRFADGSTSVLEGGCDITVLQTFLTGPATNSLYTLVRQTLGTVTYRVPAGSKFDVSTPTATAGALARNTQYKVTVNADRSGELVVKENKVYLSMLDRTQIIEAPIPDKTGDPGNPSNPNPTNDETIMLPPPVEPWIDEEW